MSTSVNALTPAPIAVEERVLEDLRSRLRAAIWPEDDGNEDGRYGVPRPLLQELAQFWAEEYDWRAAERAMNAYEHYLVDVSGTRVHFMRKPGAGPDPVPLILSHGWPWTFWHCSKVIDRLEQAEAQIALPQTIDDTLGEQLVGRIDDEQRRHVQPIIELAGNLDRRAIRNRTGRHGPECIRLHRKPCERHDLLFRGATGQDGSCGRVSNGNG